jgi:hypothetical protein
MIVVKTLRAITTVTLIAGSMYVQHVARTPQAGNKLADLQIAGGVGSDLATVASQASQRLTPPNNP